MTPKITIKKSESTDKMIVVINGRIKIGEVIDGRIIPLPNIEESLKKRIAQMNGRGGKREGSGRPKGEPTKTLSYRVPLKKANKIDKEIREIISKNLKTP
jgi:hypothetical protein